MPLQPKVLHLLDLLIARAPNAVSQEELYDALWPDSFVDRKSLHNLVYELRTALGDADRDVIRTSYGFGFSFGAPVVDAGSNPPAAGWQILVGDVEYDLREGENVVGRERDAAVRIDATSMSRRHARLIVTAAGVALEDLGSKNGTFVGERRVHYIERLEDGATIVFGTIAATLRAIRPSRSTETVR